MQVASIGFFTILLASLTAVLAVLRPSLLVRILLKPLLTDVIFSGDYLDAKKFCR